MKDPGVVIVGGGLAAQRAAETLRRRGYAGAVRMVCAEPDPPYDRPPLSKQVLAGAAGEESVGYRPAWWSGRGVPLSARHHSRLRGMRRPRTARIPPAAEPAEDQQGGGWQDEGRASAQEPPLRGVAAGADRVRDCRQPEDRGEAVQAAPPCRPDPVAQVVGQPQRRQPLAGDDPDPGPERSVGAEKGDRDPGHAGVQEGVAE